MRTRRNRVNIIKNITRRTKRKLDKTSIRYRPPSPDELLEHEENGDTEHPSLMQPNLTVSLRRLTAATLRNYKQAPDYSDSDEFSLDSEIPLLRMQQEKLSGRSKRAIKLSNGSKQTIKLSNYKQAPDYSDSDDSEIQQAEGDTEHASLMQPNLMVRLPKLTATSLRNYKQAPDYTDSDEFSSDSEIPLLRIKHEKLSTRSKRTIKLSSGSKHYKKALLRHEQKYANAKRKKYECEICEKKFKSPDYIPKHIKRMHVKLKIYTVPCGYL